MSPTVRTMKFRKKPVVIEAEQFFVGQDPETHPPEMFFDEDAGQYAIPTLEDAIAL